MEKDKLYTFPFNVTSYPLWFQICINHNILVTNKLLYQMKTNENGLCSFCQTNNETIIHLFWQCNKTQQFITNVKEWLMKYNIQCDINEKYFLLGLQEEHRYISFLSHPAYYSRVRYRSPNFRPSVCPSVRSFVRLFVRPSVRQHLRRSLVFST